MEAGDAESGHDPSSPTLATEPISTELISAEPISAEPISTEPVSTHIEEATTEPKMETQPKAETEIHTESESETETGTDAGTPTMAHDSMVTVRLSEPPTLTLDTSNSTVAAQSSEVKETAPTIDEVDSEDESDSEHEDAKPHADGDESIVEEHEALPHRDSTATLSLAESNRNLQDELGEIGSEHGSDSSEDPHEVNWEQLEKTEDEQTKDEETDNSTALLLARLEQENAKLATNPKSVKVRAVEALSGSKPSRPPSMAKLRQMVSAPAPSALRYSLIPAPPMTDLEFYAALVKDYQQTAARLPTLLSNKIRKGIPPPLRGVVWQSMSGARDAVLEEQYERFCGESSPYELLIGKDLNRSFPGVDMFREPDGDGQRMLGRVLKCFSLYDTKIGYCQGLAFLVGPLLMHMPDRQAFCVLVRLMELYDLRACFLPDLSGLHVRIYQFRELLRHNLPALSSHLEDLQVETAYVSQWFLSFFAVTCPLPMLFRIYDVLFAEGASETLMRVALSLMRKNETRLLACTELEDVMQLLLSRGLWDCYHYNADEFVQDFVSLTGVVTREKLSQLEQGYRESLIATANAARVSDITSGATRFLGRIWASSPKSATLTPNPSSSSHPLNMLRRSTSKQSLASTLNSMEASSASVVSSSSTDVTTMSRNSSTVEDDSSRESTPVGPKSIGSIKNTDDRYLHSQIEDLLTALSELQRNNALLSNQLQREREERQEDKKAVRSLLDGLRKKAIDAGHDANEAIETDHVASEASDETVKPGTAYDESTTDPEDHGVDADADVDVDRDADVERDTEADADATPTSENPQLAIPTAEDDTSDETETPSTEDLSELLDRVETRFADDDNKHRSSMLQTKAQLREDLARARDHLSSALSQTQGLNRHIHDLDQEMNVLKEQLRERHSHVRTLHQDNQRLEKQLHGLRSRASASSAVEPSNREAEPDWAAKGAASVGLREFKLGRSRSTPSQVGTFNKRMSSLPPRHESAMPSSDTTPTNEHDALLLELVQAKTAEAIAKQEAEEAKQKVETLRKAYGLAPAESSAAAAAAAVSAATAGAMGVFGRLTGTTPVVAAADSNGKTAAASAAAPAPAPGTSPAGGGFWGWRR